MDMQLSTSKGEGQVFLASLQVLIHRLSMFLLPKRISQVLVLIQILTLPLPQGLVMGLVVTQVK